ncbi:coatomer subunit gamma [Nematocida sp. LUAm3]|nr:coatomer subunit gamma [Nematocida sp. LUAm3]KAI5176019.1 coatomer subunit gamma [Nematocida sp. LUAm2]KAI5179116.1 coatomer subunit gamma [Nematocida sp. LUAm1]
MSAGVLKSKEAILSEVNAFTERVLVTRRCARALVEVIKGMNQKKFLEQEIDLVISRIFHVFQSKDAYLKHFCFSFIRSVSHMSEGSLVAISALERVLKPGQDSNKKLRADALQLLLQITPSNMLYDCSPYVQQKLIEPDFCALDQIVPALLYVSEHSISEWFDRVTWIKGLNPSGAFGNAIILMSRVKPQESKEIIRIINSTHLRGYSSVLALRYISSHIQTVKETKKRFESFFHLEETDECTFIEALRTVLKIKEVECSKYVDISIKGLRTLLLSSKNKIYRIAALRTIEMLSASSYKNKLLPLRGEIEEMLGKGSTVALLAISILLRIGTEQMTEKVSQLLPKAIAEMGEPQKLMTIDAVGKLCEKFGSSSWVDVLREALNNQGSCQYKVKVVQTISGVMKRTENEALHKKMEEILCSYVEDSPYPRLTAEILGLLMGKNSSHYKMCLMNRMILDNESVSPAINLALEAENPESLLFASGTELPENLLSDTDNKILLMAKEELGEDAKLFQVEKKKKTEMESKFGEEELKQGRKTVLTRSESEFLISATKYLFSTFIIIQYSIESRIDCILEEGKLNVYLEDKIISEEKIFLHPRKAQEVSIRVDFSSYEDISGKSISHTFSYLVNDNREYETGEVRMGAIEVSIYDFIVSSCDVHQFTPQNTEKKEFKFNMAASSVISEIKKILDLSVTEESEEEFLCRGTFAFTREPIEIRVKTKEASGKTKAEVSVSCATESLRKKILENIA